MMSQKTTPNRIQASAFSFPNSLAGKGMQVPDMERGELTIIYKHFSFLLVILFCDV